MYVILPSPVIPTFPDSNASRRGIRGLGEKQTARIEIHQNKEIATYLLSAKVIFQH